MKRREWFDETNQRDVESLDHDFYDKPDNDSKTAFLGSLLIVVQAIWIARRWTSLKILDVILGMILSFTENQRAVGSTIRVIFSKGERAAVAQSQRYKCMYLRR